MTDRQRREDGATWYQILTQTLCWSWPVILTLALLWGPDRKLLWSLVGGYLLFLLLLLCIQASSESPRLPSSSALRYLGSLCRSLFG